MPSTQAVSFKFGAVIVGGPGEWIFLGILVLLFVSAVVWTRRDGGHRDD